MNEGKEVESRKWKVESEDAFETLRKTGTGLAFLTFDSQLSTLDFLVFIHNS